MNKRVLMFILVLIYSSNVFSDDLIKITCVGKTILETQNNDIKKESNYSVSYEIEKKYHQTDETGVNKNKKVTVNDWTLKQDGQKSFYNYEYVTNTEKNDDYSRTTLTVDSFKIQLRVNHISRKKLSGERYTYLRELVIDRNSGNFSDYESDESSLKESTLSLTTKSEGKCNKTNQKF